MFTACSISIPFSIAFPFKIPLKTARARAGRGTDEAGAHPNAAGAQRQRCGQAAAVVDAARAHAGHAFGAAEVHHLGDEASTRGKRHGTEYMNIPWKSTYLPLCLAIVLMRKRSFSGTYSRTYRAI